MDGRQFDDLIKDFVTTRLSRATALRGFLAGLAAAVTGVAVTSDDAEAKNKNKKARRGNKSRRGHQDKGKGGNAAHADSKKQGKKGGNKKKGGKNKKRKSGRNPQRTRVQSVTCSEPTSVTPVSGNPPLCPDGVRVPDPGVECGTITDPCGCTIKWCVTLGDQGEELSFGPADGEEACTVTKVVVKGGNEGANVYTFDPPALCADGLTTPTNQGVSHIDFCGIDCCVPRTCEDLGDNACGTDIADQCGGTIDCGCNDKDICTTDACSTQEPGEIGTCEYTPVVCTPPNVCKTDCTCTDPEGCSCEDVVCTPQNVCEQLPCDCDPERDPACKCAPVICEPQNVCEEAPCDCDPKRDPACKCTPVVCEPKNVCEEAPCNCDPEKDPKCSCTPVVCEPQNVCEQLPCDCDPERDPKCKCAPVTCEPQNVCEEAPCSCDPEKDPACQCTPVVCTPQNACEQLPCTCDPTKDPKCSCAPVVCPPRRGCELLGCDPVEGCQYHCFEGCTPGYWKNHPAAWAGSGYTTGQTVGSVFTIPGCLSGCNLGGKSLLQALSFKGGTSLCGGAEILLRAAVAALLNSAKVDYPLTTAQVIAAVNAALASCTRATIIAEATRLDGLNNSTDADGNHNCPCTDVCP